MDVRITTRLFQILLAVAIAGFNLDGVSARSVNGGGDRSANQSIALTSSSSQNLRSQTGVETHPPENPALLQETDAGVVLELTTGAYAIEESPSGRSCQFIQVADEAASFAALNLPGWPNLPVKGVMIGIPQPTGMQVGSFNDTQPRLSVLETELVEVDGSFDLCPASHPVIEFGEAGEIRDLGIAADHDPQAYSQDEFYPREVAELSSTAYVRSQRIAQIRFQPFQYNPLSGKIRIYKRIRIALDYGVRMDSRWKDLDQSSEGFLERVTDRVFEKVLQDNLLNYESASAFRETSPAPAPSLASNAPQTGPDKIKLLVNSTGMYSVSYEDLTAAGIDLSALAPAALQVFNQGVEVAIQVIGEDDGSFDPGDRIVFYGQALDQKYTNVNVYWLTWGSANGLRMAALDVQPGGSQTSVRFKRTQHVETNSLYSSSLPDSRGDRWYWSLINAASAPASGSYTFTVAQVDLSAPGAASLRGSIKGYLGTPRHHTKLYINNNFITESTWTSGGQYDFSASFPMTYLIEGTNTLRVDLPRDGGITTDRQYFNWFELDYWKTYTAEQDELAFSGEASGNYLYQLGGFSSPSLDLFDVTNPAVPVRLTDYSVQLAGSEYQLSFRASNPSQHRYLALAQARYAAPSALSRDIEANLASSANGADYLLITHADFLAQVQALADWRASQGLRVKVIDVQDIYDEFNEGIIDPEAIRDFIAYAYQNWQPPRPLYVLLAGDGHLDPRNYMGTNEKNYIPAYLLPVDPYISETASDNRYVTVSGSDNLPDLLIGRLPVKTPAEAAALVAKLIAYEQNPPDVGWNKNVLLVTDNPDASGDYVAYSEPLADDYLPDGYNPQKVYYGTTHTSAASARAAILDSINQGDLLVNYIGHGSILGWASESLLQASSAASFANANKLPIFAMMACLNGYFHYPSPPGLDYTSIAEAVLKPAGTGAIASWASSGFGIAEGQDYLNRALYQAVFYRGQTHIGAAILQAKLDLSSQTTYFPDLLDTFTLFGDPASSLNVVPSDLAVNLSVEPSGALNNGMPITYTLTYENIGPALATDVRIDHPLPEPLTNPVVTTSGPSVTLIEGTRLVWEIASLAPGEGGEITVTGLVNVSGSNQISSQASIQSLITDADSSNNFAGPVQTPIVGPTAVQLAAVEARVFPGLVELYWETSNELSITGFNVYRAVGPGGPWTLLNTTLIPSQNFGGLNGSSYTFPDTSVQPGEIYYYRIEIIAVDGSTNFDLLPLSVSSFLFLPLAVR